MVRELKYHEKKLLKKVNLVDWNHKSQKEAKYMRKYQITREEYTKYNRLIHQIRTIVNKLKELDEDEVRMQASEQLISKLYSMGLIQSKRLKTISRLSAGSFAKRRLPVFIIKSNMFAGPLSTAIEYVKHGHVRVGPNVIRDPAYLVTRDCEDYISWTEKIRNKIDEYYGERDDYQD